MGLQQIRNTVMILFVAMKMPHSIECIRYMDLHRITPTLIDLYLLITDDVIMPLATSKEMPLEALKDAKKTLSMRKLGLVVRGERRPKPFSRLWDVKGRSI